MDTRSRIPALNSRNNRLQVPEADELFLDHICQYVLERLLYTFEARHCVQLPGLLNVAYECSFRCIRNVIGKLASDGSAKIWSEQVYARDEREGDGTLLTLGSSSSHRQDTS